LLLNSPYFRRKGLPLVLLAIEARHYVEAIALLRSALDDPRKPLTVAQRKEALSLIERSASFIARVPLRVSPPHARVSIDGRAVALDADGRVSLDAGVHQVVVSADGYDELVRSMRWDAGTSPVFEVRLEKKAVAVSAEPQSQPRASGGAPADRPSESRLGLSARRRSCPGPSVACSSKRRGVLCVATSMA
jgi:hypothetical protein